MWIKPSSPCACSKVMSFCCASALLATIRQTPMVASAFTTPILYADAGAVLPNRVIWCERIARHGRANLIHARDVQLGRKRHDRPGRRKALLLDAVRMGLRRQPHRRRDLLLDGQARRRLRGRDRAAAA